MRFPVAKLKLRVTDPDGKALSGATFTIKSGSTTVAEFTSDSKGECSIPVKLHEGDKIGYSAFLTTGDQTGQTYVIKETPPAGYKETSHVLFIYIISHIPLLRLPIIQPGSVLMILASNRVHIVWKRLLVIRILFMSHTTKANSALSISVKLITPEILYPTPI